MIFQSPGRLFRTSLVGISARTAIVGHQQQRAMEAPTQTTETGRPEDAIAELERLGKLKEEGALSDEEFAAEKAKILSL